jgi:hypothetical protein
MLIFPVECNKGDQQMEVLHTGKTDAPAESSQARAAYAAPTLMRWGTLRDMTQAVGNSGRSDGGKKGGQKRTR